MELTMIYDGSEIPFLGQNDATLARHGRFASCTGWIGVATEVRIVAPRLVADVPGSSAPNGRRLRN